MASHRVVEIYNRVPEFTFVNRTPELSNPNRLDRGTVIRAHGRAHDLVVVKRTGEKAFVREWDGHAPPTRVTGSARTIMLRRA